MSTLKDTCNSTFKACSWEMGAVHGRGGGTSDSLPCSLQKEARMLYSVYTKEYISLIEGTATSHRLTKIWLTQPLPALSALCCTTCLSVYNCRQGRPGGVGWVKFCKTMECCCPTTSDILYILCCTLSWCCCPHRAVKLSWSANYSYSYDYRR